MAYRKRIASGKNGWDRNYYENGLSGGDDQVMYNGMDRDNLRWGRPNMPPMSGHGRHAGQLRYRDYDGNFGGPHSGVVLMGMCDGSVHSISFDIDPVMHGRLANRKDGEVTTLP